MIFSSKNGKKYFTTTTTTTTKFARIVTIFLILLQIRIY